MSAPIEPTPGVLRSARNKPQTFRHAIGELRDSCFRSLKPAYKPLLAKMDEREKKINDGLSFSEDAEKKMEEMKFEKCRDPSSGQKAEAHQIIEQAGSPCVSVAESTS